MALSATPKPRRTRKLRRGRTASTRGTRRTAGPPRRTTAGATGKGRRDADWSGGGGTQNRASRRERTRRSIQVLPPRLRSASHARDDRHLRVRRRGPSPSSPCPFAQAIRTGLVPDGECLCYTPPGSRPRDFSPKPRAMISLQRVTKVYRNGTTALDDVSMEVEKGEFVFIVGASGSGKSTMIRLLLKEDEATKGDIYVAGKNVAKLTAWKVPHLRRNIGTVFQDFKLLQDKTVFENVAFALEVIGKTKNVIDQRVPEILDLVGLGDKLNNYPDELSGGEQQRVSLARACVNRPLVLLADEPTGNLDPSTSVDIMRLLDKVNRIGTTIVMATHDQAIVDAMRRRVIELEKGKVVRDQSRGVYS